MDTSSETATVTVNDFCRMCLNQHGSRNMLPLRSYSTAENVPIVHLLVLVCGMPANLDDGLPQQLCLDCLSRLEQSYRFTRESKDNETILGRFSSAGSVLQSLINYQNLRVGAGPGPVDALSAVETAQRIPRRRPEERTNAVLHNRAESCAIAMPLPMLEPVEVKRQSTSSPRHSTTDSTDGTSFSSTQPPLKKSPANLKYISRNGRFRCPTCPYVVASRNAFSHHMVEHRAVEEERFKCKSCNKVFRCRRSLQRHLKNVKKCT